MKSTAKVLVPNKEWLVWSGHQKIGSISKSKKGYSFLRQGAHFQFKNLNDIKATFGITFFEQSGPKKSKNLPAEHSIYNYPCDAEPYDPVYDVKRKLPIFTKEPKSKSHYSAGYFIIKYRKGWEKCFCPKLIALERYPYQGPFFTEQEATEAINATTKHTPN